MTVITHKLTTAYFSAAKRSTEVLASQSGLKRLASSQGMFCLTLILLYVAFSPGTIEGMGYYRENLFAVEQLVTNAGNLLHGHALIPVNWSRHGGLELLLELPFVLLGHFLPGDALKWAGRLLALQPILATALLCTLLRVWLLELSFSSKQSLLLVLAAAFTTMYWPYAYMGLETSQSLSLLLVGFWAFRQPRHQSWPAVLGFALCCACAVSLKTTGVFLLPAVAFAMFQYFRVLPQTSAARLPKLLVTLAIVGIMYAGNAALKEKYYAAAADNSAHAFSALLVNDPWLFFFQAFSFFGSVNKSLLLFAPLTAWALWRLPRAFAANRSLTIFALLALGGLVFGFSLVRVWTEETWGPRYLHSGIAPLLLCLAVSQRAQPAQIRLANFWLPLAATSLLGLAINLPGVLIPYVSLHQIATRSSHHTLTAIQYDPAWNHVRVNYKLFGLWLFAREGQSVAPVPWPPPQSWWFEKPEPAPAETTVDLRGWAMPQPILLQQWRPTQSASQRLHQLTRGIFLGCLLLGLLLFFWQLKTVGKVRETVAQVADHV
ncbi:MAG: hypothetical protein JNJ50_27100 [Acidobacteria bacterium]|nr:hypothetical protein [Acidobacteriota bacterium]